MNKLALLAATGIFAITAPAFAWKAYHLEGDKYAILCADGAIFTYSGSGSGLSISGDALCEGHGGIAGGGPTGRIKQATPVRDAAGAGGTGPAQTGSAYIHRPDSTQYHPGGQTKATRPTARAGYRHRPDSTQYRPPPTAGNTAAPAARAGGYIHRPDSTQYHPGGKKSDAAATEAGAGAGISPARPGSAYIHRPDSTQYHPSQKKK